MVVVDVVMGLEGLAIFRKLKLETRERKSRKGLFVFVFFFKVKWDDMSVLFIAFFFLE